MTTEEKWVERVGAWRRSGKTAAEYSEGKDFEASTLRYWSSRLQTTRAAASGRPVRWARVVRTGETRIESAIVVELGGARVTVRAGADEKTLAVVLGIMAGQEGGR